MSWNGLGHHMRRCACTPIWFSEQKMFSLGSRHLLRNRKVCVQQHFAHRKFSAKNSVPYLQFAIWYPCSSKKKERGLRTELILLLAIVEFCFSKQEKLPFPKSVFPQYHQFFVAKQRNYFLRDAQKHFCFFCWHSANILFATDQNWLLRDSLFTSFPRWSA